MAVVNELIRSEANGSISFGNYELSAKTKLSDFEHEGNLYKVKTFNEITKLERNGMFVYESVPGTAVEGFAASENGVSFVVYGTGDVQITVGLEESTEYKVLVDGAPSDQLKTNLGGKLSMSLDLAGKDGVKVTIEK